MVGGFFLDVAERFGGVVGEFGVPVLQNLLEMLHLARRHVLLMLAQRIGLYAVNQQGFLAAGHAR